MILKWERPETDDFVVKKNLVVKEKYNYKMKIIVIFQEISSNLILADTLTKMLAMALRLGCV